LQNKQFVSFSTFAIYTDKNWVMPKPEQGINLDAMTHKYSVR